MWSLEKHPLSEANGSCWNVSANESQLTLSACLPYAQHWVGSPKTFQLCRLRSLCRCVIEGHQLRSERINRVRGPASRWWNWGLVTGCESQGLHGGVTIKDSKQSLPKTSLTCCTYWPFSCLHQGLLGVCRPSQCSASHSSPWAHPIYIRAVLWLDNF